MGENLKEIKQSLQEALGLEDFGRYLKLLKKWFSQSLTKEQFDTHARRLIAPDKIHHHNAFFVAILSKCNIQYTPSSSISNSTSSSTSTSSVQPSSSRKGLQALKRILSKNAASHGPEKRFRPSEPIQSVQTSKASQPVPDPLLAIPDNLTVCTKDGLLPDRSTMFGRALVIAWESGMENIEERSIDLLVLATRDLLKNVLHSAIQLRRNYVVSNSGFPYLFGVDPSLATANSSLASRSLTQTYPEYYQCILASRSKPAGQIRLRDIYDGLKTRPDVLPCQTVSSVVLERILCKLDDQMSRDVNSDS